MTTLWGPRCYYSLQPLVVSCFQCYPNFLGNLCYFLLLSWFGFHFVIFSYPVSKYVSVVMISVGIAMCLLVSADDKVRIWKDISEGEWDWEEYVLVRSIVVLHLNLLKKFWEYIEALHWQPILRVSGVFFGKKFNFFFQFRGLVSIHCPFDFVYPRRFKKMQCSNLQISNDGLSLYSE